MIQRRCKKRTVALVSLQALSPRAYYYTICKKASKTCLSYSFIDVSNVKRRKYLEKISTLVSVAMTRPQPKLTKSTVQILKMSCYHHLSNINQMKVHCLLNVKLWPVHLLRLVHLSVKPQMGKHTEHQSAFLVLTCTSNNYHICSRPWQCYNALCLLFSLYFWVFFCNMLRWWVFALLVLLVYVQKFDGVVSIVDSSICALKNPPIFNHPMTLSKHLAISYQLSKLHNDVFQLYGSFRVFTLNSTLHTAITHVITVLEQRSYMWILMVYLCVDYRCTWVQTWYLNN